MSRRLYRAGCLALVTACVVAHLRGADLPAVPTAPVQPAASYMSNAKVSALWQDDLALRDLLAGRDAEIARLNDLLAAHSPLPATPTADPAVAQQITNLSQQLSQISASLETMRVDQSAAAQSLGAVEQSTQALIQRFAEERRVIFVPTGTALKINADGSVIVPSYAFPVIGTVSVEPDTTAATPPDASVPAPAPAAAPIVSTVITTYVETSSRTWTLTSPAGSVALNGVDTGLAGADGIYDDDIYVLAHTAAGAWLKWINNTWAPAAAPASALARKDK